MTLVGEMAFGLVARTEGLKRGFREGRREINEFKQFTQKTLGSVGAAVAGIATFATARAAVSSLVDEALRIDELDTRATIIGTTARELSALRYAADQTDVSTAVLEKSIIKLRKSIGDAGELKTAKDALAALKLSQDEIVQQDAVTQFMRTIQALREMKNETLQTKYAMDLLGRSGAELLPLIRGSAEGFNRFLEEGRTLSASLTDEVVKSATKVDEMMKRWDASWSNLKRKMIDSRFGKWVLDGVEGADAVIDGSLWRPSISGIRGELIDLGKEIQDQKRNIDYLMSEGYTGLLEEPLKRLNELQDKYRSVARMVAADDFRIASENELRAFDELMANMNKLDHVPTWWTAIKKAGSDAIEDLSAKAKMLGEDLASAFRLDQAERFKAFLRDLEAQADAIRDAIKTPEMRLQDEMTRVADLVRRGLLDAGDAERFLLDQADRFKPTRQTPTPASANLARSNEAENSIARAIARAQDQGSTKKDKVNEDIRDAVKKAAAEAEKQTATLKAISSKLDVSYANLN